MHWYVGSLQILPNTYSTTLTTKQVVRKLLFTSCLIQRIILLPIKMTKQKNARIKQVLR